MANSAFTKSTIATPVSHENGGLEIDASAFDGLLVISGGTTSVATKTGLDADVVTGTAGATDSLAKWNADGDLVDAGFGVTTGTPAKGSILAGDGIDSFDEVSAGSDNQIVTYASGESLGVKAVFLDGTIQLILDGGGSALTTGVKAAVQVPFDCTITENTLVSPIESGSLVIDIWKDTYANFPATDADSITASAPPTLSSSQKSTDSTLTGWTTTLTAGEWLIFNVDSAATITNATLSVGIRRNF